MLTFVPIAFYETLCVNRSAINRLSTSPFFQSHSMWSLSLLSKSKTVMYFSARLNFLLRKGVAEEVSLQVKDVASSVESGEHLHVVVAKGVVSCWVGALVVWNSAGADENIRHEMIAIHTALDGLRVTMSTGDEHIRSSVDTHC
jgi:hypothetical protein